MLFRMLPKVSRLEKRDCPAGDSLDYLSYTSFKIFTAPGLGTGRSMEAVSAGDNRFGAGAAMEKWSAFAWRQKNYSGRQREASIQQVRNQHGVCKRLLLAQ